MNQENKNDVVQQIGAEIFEWLALKFNKNTTLEDLPEGLLDSICKIDTTIRDFSSDPNAITAIALITFSYKLANKQQQAHYGSNDLLLVKVLVKNELAKRKGEKTLDNEMWKAPVYELITGKVGEEIRATKFMTNPA